MSKIFLWYPELPPNATSPTKIAVCLLDAEVREGWLQSPRLVSLGGKDRRPLFDVRLEEDREFLRAFAARHAAGREKGASLDLVIARATPPMEAWFVDLLGGSVPWLTSETLQRLDGLDGCLVVLRKRLDRETFRFSAQLIGLPLGLSSERAESFDATWSAFGAYPDTPPELPIDMADGDRAIAWQTMLSHGNARALRSAEPAVETPEASLLLEDQSWLLSMADRDYRIPLRCLGSPEPHRPKLPPTLYAQLQELVLEWTTYFRERRLPNTLAYDSRRGRFFTSRSSWSLIEQDDGDLLCEHPAYVWDVELELPSGREVFEPRVHPMDLSLVMELATATEELREYRLPSSSYFSLSLRRSRYHLRYTMEPVRCLIGWRNPGGIPDETAQELLEWLESRVVTSDRLFTNALRALVGMKDKIQFARFRRRPG